MRIVSPPLGESGKQCSTLPLAALPNTSCYSRSNSAALSLRALAILSRLSIDTLRWQRSTEKM